MRVDTDIVKGIQFTLPEEQLEESMQLLNNLYDIHHHFVDEGRSEIDIIYEIEGSTIDVVVDNFEYSAEVNCEHNESKFI